MAELLTTKQLQDLLKIDRITVYRMLDDGRIKGVKIGNQWRFPQSEIDRLLGDKKAPVEDTSMETLCDFPANCVSEVEGIFAGIIGIGAVTVTMQGTPLTEPIFSNPFCKLMMSCESGQQACHASWRSIATKSTGNPTFQVCHAGLCYKRSPIEADERQIAWLIAGQYFVNEADVQGHSEHVHELAQKHHLPEEKLQEASKKIPVLKKYQQDQVQEWTPKVAATVQAILFERADLMSRLKRIAELSSINASLSK
jgi:excisionase family DNA binding protein